MVEPIPSWMGGSAPRQESSVAQLSGVIGAVALRLQLVDDHSVDISLPPAFGCVVLGYHFVDIPLPPPFGCVVL